MNFYQITEAVAQRNCIAVGYRHAQEQIVSNPDKKESVTFHKGDSLIVLAEDDMS